MKGKRIGSFAFANEETKGVFMEVTQHMLWETVAEIRDGATDEQTKLFGAALLQMIKEVEPLEVGEEYKPTSTAVEAAISTVIYAIEMMGGVFDEEGMGNEIH